MKIVNCVSYIHLQYVILFTSTNMQVPSSDFPTRELFRGKQVASLKDNNNGSTAEGDQDNDITLMIFWQVQCITSTHVHVCSISIEEKI